MGLPKNAFRRLGQGEKYIPVITANTREPEVTARSVLLGTAICSLFSVMMVYLTLKFGQGIEVAIPIGVLALGASAIARRPSSPIENVNILAWGSTSGIVTAAACFVLPALFMLKLEVDVWEMALTLALGSILGVLFLIPFRRYFCVETHGQFPFPEGTAIANILNAVSTALQDTKRLFGFLGLGVGVDYVGSAFKPWGQVFSLQAIPGLATAMGKTKLIFDMGTNATYLGLGYIMGLRFAIQIAAGSFLMFFVFVPLIGGIGADYISLSAGKIFGGVADKGIYGAKYIGIGAIFAAGIISIIKMSPQIVKALRQTIGQGLRGAGTAGLERTDRDINMATVGGMFLFVAIVMIVFLRYSLLADQNSPWLLAIMSTVAVYVVIFLFTAVSAWAIAVISVTPVSGMTLVTLFMVALLLMACGLKSGDAGMKAVLLIGTIACTAVSMAGSLITQFKVGYWFGSTPSRIQWSNIVASILPAVLSAVVLVWFASMYTFGTEVDEAKRMLAAPQASAMAAVVGSIMGGKAMPWLFAGVGVAVSAIVTLLGLSPLALALGMYLPMEINVPIVFGALVSWLIQRGAGQNQKLAEARLNRGNLAATGLLAGGAFAGVLNALTVWVVNKIGAKEMPSFGFSDEYLNYSSLLPFIGVAVLLYYFASRAKVEEEI